MATRRPSEGRTETALSVLVRTETDGNDGQVCHIPETPHARNATFRKRHMPETAHAILGRPRQISVDNEIR